jgi:hypothetical protein
MGRASRTKRERRDLAQRLALIRAGTDRVCEKVCDSCGFFDRTATEDDPDLVWKIAAALKLGKRFVCHDGMPQNERGEYIPTQEQMDAAPLCAAFAAVRKEFARVAPSGAETKGAGHGT